MDNTKIPQNNDGTVRWKEEKKIARLKLCVALPHQHYYSTGIAEMLFELKDVCAKMGFEPPHVVMRGERPHDLCRNLMANDFMQVSKADWLLSIDADMLPQTEQVLQMVLDADREGRKLVSAHCNGMLRGLPVSVGFIRVGGTDEIPQWSRIEVTPDMGVTPVDAFGTGCYAVHRDVFAALPQPWYKFTYLPNGLARIMGEDVYFTYAAKQAGIQPWYDTRLHVPHLKEVAI